MYKHTQYDYDEAVRADVLVHIQENDVDVTSEDFDREALLEDLQACDSVTGNASGSYTFNTWQAQLNLVGNTFLMDCAQEEFDLSVDTVLDPEQLDVSIRIYVLNETLDDILEELGWDGTSCL